MSRGGKSYTRQFREQAMDLVRVQGLDPAHAARELGMPFSTLGLWLRKAGWVKPVDRAVPLPEDPAAFPFREPSPHAVLLTGGESMLETRLADRAGAADHLGLLGQDLVLGRGVEDGRIAPAATAGQAPGLRGLHRHLLRAPEQFQQTVHDLSPQARKRKTSEDLYSRSRPRLCRECGDLPNIRTGNRLGER